MSDKQPAKHRKPRHRSAKAAARARSAAGLTAAAAASVAVIADPGSADAAPTSPTQARAELDRLYQQSEQATQDYDQATTRLRALQRKADDDRTRLARRESALLSTRTALGAVAAAQYRTGAYTTSFRLAFSGGPDRFLEQAGALNQVTQAERRVLDQYGRQVRALAADRAAAESEVAGAEAEQQRLAAAKGRIRHALSQAQQLLSTLSAAERTNAEPGSTAAPPDTPAPNAVAAAVLSFAKAQLGKPYAWGAVGPDSYDCSGLTEKAYAAAGIAIPRTTYQQVDTGHRIPVAQLAPGDLVFYYSGVTHVGIYAGGGRIIHAPHPGAPVRYAPLDSMPISATTRPA